MLHLKFALNLEYLADEMIENISRCWKNPFVSPVVIFPDPKLEQWFRLRWIQKKGALAGLSTMMIDRFLMEILVGNEKGKEKLSADMLCNVILAYLKKQDMGCNNYEKLGGEVLRYLTAANKDGGSLDETHLFDFAQKMASLFLEYETSRPRDFIQNANGNSAEGILDKWKQGHLEDFFATKNNNIKEREEWQRMLYSQLFHQQGDKDSLLTQVFKKEGARKKEEPVEYLTIPFLYESCLNHNEANFHLEKFTDGGQVQPLFIFGLSGMGQFYRVILHKYAARHEVFAYIQNPCMEFWEDVSNRQSPQDLRHHWEVQNGIWKDGKGGNFEDVKKRLSVNLSETTITDPDDIPEYENKAENDQENSLLSSWGKSGRDNIKLWCQAANYDFDFKVERDVQDASDLPKDTLLHQVQYTIANRINELPENRPTDESVRGQNEDEFCYDSLTLTAAPTKIREVEALHSRICKLLQNGARISDILVESPDLDSYRTAIKTVFDQSSEGLQVPFSIVDSPARSSLTENALESLFMISAERTISRPRFFDLMRNSVVQQTRGISNEEVNDWESWIVETNVYRDRDSKKEDWADGVRRLLLAKMTKHMTQFSNGCDTKELKPFADMASSNNASLCRFVEAIKDLKDWIDFSKKDSISDLDSLNEHLNSWLAMTSIPDSLTGESIVYKRVVESLDNLHYQLDTGIDGISWKIIQQSLTTAAQGSAYSCGSLFVNGITFMKFIPNRIIPVKHLFFMGANSSCFPGTKQQNTLDLRKACRPWPGDDSPIAKRRYAFLCQLMSVSEGLHISYIHQDIRKDAELYPSSVIGDIQKLLERNNISWKAEKISLDEDRKTQELFTPKSLRNKKAYVDMTLNGFASVRKNNDINKALSKDNIIIKPPERVSFYQLRKFLEDPFQFRIGMMMMEFDEDNPERELFEPIYFDHLEQSNLFKALLAAELSNNNEELEKYKQEVKRKGKMPDKIFEDKIWNSLEEKKAMILQQMGEEKIQEVKNCWTFNSRLQDLQLVQEDNTKWNLSGSMDWCNSENLEDVTQIFSITTSDQIKASKYMASYIRALALLAYKGEKHPSLKDQEQSITITIYFCKAQEKPAETTLLASPSKAKDILKEIYVNAFGSKETKPFSKAVPVDMQKESFKNIFEFKSKLLESHGPWSFFNKKNLFDPLRDVGFDSNEEEFREQWNAACTKMSSLILLDLTEKKKKEA